MSSPIYPLKPTDSARDWFCIKCGFNNLIEWPNCQRCQALNPTLPILQQNWFCPRCGVSNMMAAANCTHCSTPYPYRPQAPAQQYYQGPQYPSQPIPIALIYPPKSRVAFILLGLFLGGLGIHNFYAGYSGRGAAQLLIIIFTFWLIFPIFIVGIWVIIEIIAIDTDASGQRMR